jgi:uncharacterized iron-regulated membrane protein
VLRRVHLWVGLLAGLHLTVLSVTGAALVYRSELQRALHPHLFAASTPGPRADPVAVLEAVAEAFPGGRVSGVDAPTRSRETYLAYVVQDEGFRTVLVDPVTARPLGELPERSLVRALQDLHFELLAGRTGRRVNGVSALLVLVLAATGVGLWRARGRSGEGNRGEDPRRLRRRTLRGLHGAVGMGSLLFLGMWALTGVYLAFPSQLRAVVGLVSPTAPPPTPWVESGSGGRGPGENGAEGVGPELATLLQRARAAAPGQHVARVILPVDEESPLLVQLSPAFRRTGSDPRLTSVYLDPHAGGVVEVQGPGPASPGHALTSWVRPLHAGDLGSPFLKLIWFLGALAPPLLFATGFRIWWIRLVGRGPPPGASPGRHPLEDAAGPLRPPWPG